MKNANNVINNVDLKIQNELNNKSNNIRNNQIDPLMNTENIIQNKEENKENNDNNDKDVEKNEINLEDIKIENKEENGIKIPEHNSDSNININEEIEKKNLEKKDVYLNSIQSSFKPNIIDNSEMRSSNASQKYQNYNLTQTSSNFNYLFPTKNNFEIIIPCQEERLILEKNKEEQENVISKENDIKIIGDKISNKNKFMKNINEIDINSFEGKEELKNMENKLEILLNNIRIKLGNNYENTEIENVLEKYSMMLLEKIENSLNKNK